MRCARGAVVGLLALRLREAWGFTSWTGSGWQPPHPHAPASHYSEAPWLCKYPDAVTVRWATTGVPSPAEAARAGAVAPPHASTPVPIPSTPKAPGPQGPEKPTVLANRRKGRTADELRQALSVSPRRLDNRLSACSLLTGAA
jgi:hypothetical protein